MPIKQGILQVAYIFLGFKNKCLFSEWRKEWEYKAPGIISNVYK